MLCFTAAAVNETGNGDGNSLTHAGKVQAAEANKTTNICLGPCLPIFPSLNV